MLPLPSLRFYRTAYLQAFGQVRQASSKRWQARQQKDQFTKEAAVQGLKSRAAFKLLQVDISWVALFQ
jgi:21S rRNA (uridine2791-2'-O)-methyltransferase